MYVYSKSSCSSLLVEPCDVCLVKSSTDFDVHDTDFFFLFFKNAIRILLSCPHSSSCALFHFLRSASLNFNVSSVVFL